MVSLLPLLAPHSRTGGQNTWSWTTIGIIDIKYPRLLTGHDAARGANQDVLQKPVGRAGSGQERWKSHGSSRVKRCWKSHRSSRVGSRGIQTSRVGPDHPDTTRTATSDPTREEPWRVTLFSTVSVPRTVPA